jgi:hypothetical protein
MIPNEKKKKKEKEGDSVVAFSLFKAININKYRRTCIFPFSWSLVI